MAMTITNQTNQDYWFGPLHLPAGIGTGTLVVDDTDEVSLYRKDDAVADAINSLYSQTPAKITVSGAAAPFPRPTGTPTVLHGNGSPEGVLFAPAGALFLRRDGAQIYQKTSLVHSSIGWTALGGVGRDQAKRLGMGYSGECWNRDTQRDTIVMTTGDCYATANGFLAGDVISTVILNVTTAVSGITLFKVGLWDVNGNLVASSANSTSAQSAGILVTPLSAPYAVVADGLYYLGAVLAATTMGSYGGLTGFTGKESPIGSGPKGALKKASNSDIPSSLGTGLQSDNTLWLAWN